MLNAENVSDFETLTGDSFRVPNQNCVRLEYNINEDASSSINR